MADGALGNLMKQFGIPKKILNCIDGKDIPPKKREYFKKLNPHNGKTLCEVARSNISDVTAAVNSARKVQPIWAAIPPVKRGEILFEIAAKMNESKKTIASLVSLETGKSLKDALGETDGAISLAYFMAGEGQRMYGRTTTSSIPNKYAMTVREPVGVAGLIISANTPIANIAWKVFPSLICGNGTVLKSPADAPLTAWIFGKIIHKTALPKGVFNIIHGKGEEAGLPLVKNADINLISFTGSTEVGKQLAKIAGERLIKISLELGGKNPLVVCDDADLNNAVHWCILSAFSNTGQRCAAAGRIIVFEKIYETFRKTLLRETKKLKIGPKDTDDFGPVINEKQLTRMIAMVESAKQRGAKISYGGKRLMDSYHKNGFYMSATIIEDIRPKDPISVTELFGPVACLYKVKSFMEALQLANNSPYGLTACIHTTDVNKSIEFTRKVQAGTVVVNGGTYGSEPHMPFGGVKQSGNGTREPGTEALDIYSNTKNIYEFVDISKL